MSKRYVCYVSDKKTKLIDWLDQQSNISAVMVAALEMYQAGETGTQPLDTEAIRQVLREELALVSFTNGTSGPDRAESDEDPDVVQGMNTLVGVWDFGDDEKEA